jgi:hypothetical protein
LNAESLRESVGREADATEEAFASLAGDASAALVAGVERACALSSGISRTKWHALQTVGDQSAYVDTCDAALRSAAKAARKILRKNTFAFFCEKLAAAVAHEAYVSILRSKRVGDLGAQQLLLDVQSVKKILLELPLAGNGEFPESQSAISRTHRRFVERETGKCESLCKVLMSPVEGLRETFEALLPEGSPADFAAVCELKGMKRQDAAHAARTLRAVQAARGQ